MLPTCFSLRQSLSITVTPSGGISQPELQQKGHTTLVFIGYEWKEISGTASRLHRCGCGIELHRRVCETGPKGK